MATPSVKIETPQISGEFTISCPLISDISNPPESVRLGITPREISRISKYKYLHIIFYDPSNYVSYYANIDRIVSNIENEEVTINCSVTISGTRLTITFENADAVDIDSWAVYVQD